jgi:hypothetical protein
MTLQTRAIIKSTYDWREDGELVTDMQVYPKGLEWIPKPP